jgi:hypothetical protein
MPPPSPTLLPTPIPSLEPYTPGGTDPHTPPQATVQGRHIVTDGSNWIEQDESGNQFGRWSWSDQEGMWMYEDFQPSQNQFFTNLLSTPLGTITLVAVSLLIIGLIVWICISHIVKRRW